MSNERLEVLGGLPLFEPLSPDERERLAAGCRMRTFARGAALFREGERADGMHIVLRGVVKVVRFAPDGREMVLHLVRKGNTIGEAAMFQKGTFPASAVAVDDVETLFLQADALFTLVTENPEMALRMLAALSLRLRMFAHKLAAQGQGGAACRLATYLLHRRQIGGGDSDWPVKRFPAGCPGSPRRVWSSGGEKTSLFLTFPLCRPLPQRETDRWNVGYAPRVPVCGIAAEEGGLWGSTRTCSTVPNG